MTDLDKSKTELAAELAELKLELQRLLEEQSQRRQAEEALRESEARYRLLMESTPDAMVLYDPLGSVIYVNAAFVSTYGWSREEWLGRRIDFVPPAEVEKTRKAIANTLVGGSVVLESQRLTKDSRLLEVQLKTAAFRGPGGEVTGIYVIHRDITEIKKVEHALQESEQRYRQLLNASPDPISVYDDKGKVTYINPAFSQAFGWSLEELAGKGIDFVPEHELEKTRDAVMRTLAGETVVLESQRLTKDGRLVDIQLKTARFTDEQGNLAGDIVIYRDITERKQAEQALRDSEARYRQLLDASPDPISVYDDQGKITYLNPAFEQTFGWSEKDVSGEGLEFVPEHEMERTRDAVMRTLAGENVLLESQRLTKDGRLVDIQLKTARFTDNQGNLAGDIVIYRDITERKQREEELTRHRDHLEELVKERTAELTQSMDLLKREVSERRRTARALSEAEAKYRSLLNSSADAIIVYGMEGRVQYLNSAFTQLFGWSSDEVVGGRLDFVPDSEKEITRRRVRSVVSRDQIVREFQTKRLTKDGNTLDVNISASRFVDDKGETGGMVVILRDTTESLQAQRERRRLEKQLRQAQKMEAVGVLSSGIAHDFNNILQSLSGYIQLTSLKKTGSESDFSTQLGEMERLVDRGADLVRGLLTFGRKMEPELVPVDLNRVVTSTVKMLRRTIPKMIDIQTCLGRQMVSIDGDVNQLETLLMNLASNAGDAMPQGGRLLIETERLNWKELENAAPPEMVPGAYILLKVSDTGQGMDPETVEHIFEPFFTTKGVGQGTGLGLSTIYGIVKGHGGQIHCQSSPGQGTSFSIYLPATEAASWSQETSEAVQVRQVEGGQETVLIVDDEDPIRETVREVLENFGYRVITADSGEKALEFYREDGRSIGLVIMDLGMPGMGGQLCLQEIISLDPQARVIIASGYAGGEQAKQVLEEGAVGFIAKPYKLTDMLNTVRQVLDRPGETSPLPVQG